MRLDEKCDLGLAKFERSFRHLSEGIGKYVYFRVRFRRDKNIKNL